MKNIIEEYNLYQRMKNRTEAPTEKLMTNEILEKVQMHLIVNFITKLLIVVEKNTVLVIYNRLLKMVHFVATIEKTLVKKLAKLFRNNIQKFHRLLERIISDRSLQFAVKQTKKLNKMLKIEIRLSTVFHLQTDGQMEWMNQELEQYLRFFIENRQRDQLKWLAIVEFSVNNKVYLVTKVSPFMANYERELRIEVDIWRKEKIEKIIKFVKRMKKVQKKVGTTLRKVQKEMKRQANREQREMEKQK